MAKKRMKAPGGKTTSQKWLGMLDIHQNEGSQLEWLACNMGRLYEKVEKLEREVSSLKGRITKLKKARKS